MNNVFDKMFLFLIIFSLLIVTVFSSITPKETIEETSFEATGIFSECGSATKYFNEHHQNNSWGFNGTYNCSTKTYTALDDSKYCMNKPPLGSKVVWVN